MARSALQEIVAENIRFFAQERESVLDNLAEFAEVSRRQLYNFLAGENDTPSVGWPDSGSSRSTRQRLNVACPPCVARRRVRPACPVRIGAVIGDSGESMKPARSGGPLCASEMGARIRATSGTTVRSLERLGDVVSKLPDGRYAIDDPPFAAWISWRSPGGAAVPMKLVGDEAELRVAESSRASASTWFINHAHRAARSTCSRFADPNSSACR